MLRHIPLPRKPCQCRPKDVRKVAVGSYRGEVVIDSQIDHFLLRNGNVEDLFLESECVLKSSRSTHSAFVTLAPSSEASSIRTEAQADKVFAKKYLFKNLPHSLKPLFLRHRSLVVWDLSWYLLSRGISVPAPSGYLSKQIGPFCLAGYFFSEAIPDCVSLLELAKHPEKSRFRAECGGAMELVVEHVAAMHEGGVTHGDLKWSNILFDGSLNKLWLVDLDSARYHGRGLEPRRVARDLARFVLNAKELGVGDVGEYFLEAYARRRKLSRQRLDGPVNGVLRKLSERHRRRGLPRTQ